MENLNNRAKYKGGLRYYLWPGMENSVDPLERAIAQYETGMSPKDIDAGEWEGMYSTAIEYLKISGRISQHINPRFIVHSWKEVHGFFQNLIESTSGKNKWLINQLIKYLEYIGMSDFVGFNDEIFDYFIRISSMSLSIVFVGVSTIRPFSISS